MRNEVLTGAITSVGLALALSACGGGTSEQTTTTTTTARRSREVSAEEQAQADARAGVQIEGLMGTISQDQVNMTLQPRTETFARCFTQGAGVDFLGGDIRLSFRIHVDGSVAWVFPSQTTIGHRAVERCIVERARGVRFPRPRGGEAEFTWGFGYDAPLGHPPAAQLGRDAHLLDAREQRRGARVAVRRPARLPRDRLRADRRTRDGGGRRDAVERHRGAARLHRDGRLGLDDARPRQLPGQGIVRSLNASAPIRPSEVARSFSLSFFAEHRSARWRPR